MGDFRPNDIGAVVLAGRELVTDGQHFTSDAICSGRSFTRYEGGWTVEEGETATQVGYELFADPAFSVPGFIIERLLQRDAREMIQRLQVEIGARSTGASARDRATTSPRVDASGDPGGSGVSRGGISGTHVLRGSA